MVLLVFAVLIGAVILLFAAVFFAALNVAPIVADYEI